MTTTPYAERPPWVLTDAERALVDAEIVRLTAERAPAPPTGAVTYCEEHDEAGECTQECVDFTASLTDHGDYEMRVYSDYLGGESSIDWSGCHRPTPMPETEFYLDTERRAVAERLVHPEDCQCGKPECPPVIEDDAFTNVMGDRSGESWTLTEEGWKRA